MSTGSDHLVPLSTAGRVVLDAAASERHGVGMGVVWRRLVVVAVVVLLTLVAVVATGTTSAALVAPDPDASSASRDASSTPSSAGSLTLTGGSPPNVSPSQRWRWPLQPQPQVVARFDPPEVVWGAGHRGVDLAATVGQDVLSPTEGVVTFSGVVVDRGVLVVTTSSGLRTTFEPVDGGLPVGTPVAAGRPIGRVAATPGHCAPATCLHWGVLRDDTYLDPLALVASTRVILLPLLPRAPP